MPCRYQFSLKALLLSISFCAAGVGCSSVSLNSDWWFVARITGCTLFGVALGLPFGHLWPLAAVGFVVGVVWAFQGMTML